MSHDPSLPSPSGPDAIPVAPRPALPGGPGVLASFSQRAELVECMDRPDCSQAKLYRTLDQFRWINAWLTRYRYLLRRYMFRDMLSQPDRVWRLLDLGAGGCDITVWALRHAARRGLRLQATALERDPRTVAFARARHRMAGLQIIEGDALDPACWGPVDYVFGNHFLHHLDGGELVRLLRLVGRHTGRLFVFSDIRRSRLAYLGFGVLMGLLAHRSFAWADGLTSIRRGFLPHELQAVLREAGVESPARIQRLIPYRLAVLGGPALAGLNRQRRP